jgi:hypothetical protein
MSKENARSWRLLLSAVTAMVMAIVVALNVGAAADVSGGAPVQGQQSPSPSGTRSSSPPEETCNPGPDPLCIPEEEEPSASRSPSVSPSPSPSPGGGGDTYKAKITIDYKEKNESFVGKVDSRAICQKARRIDLFEVAPGKDQNRGHSLTNNKGRYRIPFPDADGRFYTKARKSTPERNTTCKGATSKTISV